jgi:hypothetical protein
MAETNEPNHYELLLAIGKLDVKFEAHANSMEDLKSEVSETVKRLRALEEYINEHKGAIRLAKWIVGLLIGVLGVVTAVKHLFLGQ